MCESSLVLSGSTCEVSCSRGSYIQSTTLENKGVFENNTCQSCDANCYECALQGTNKCTSCNKGSYLTLSTAGEISGLCSNISNDVLILNVFVKAKYIENSGDGSYSNPFGNIAKALSYIEEQASMYSGATVNIYLLKGDHFMTRNFAHYNYQKSKTSQYSYNYDVNIQPVFCGQTLGGHPFGTSDADCINNSDKITVYYQMGSTFHFTIPKSLTISSVIFDALDSSLVPTEKCLNENAQCCTLNLDKTMSVNNLNPNPPSVCSVQTIQTEECKAAFGSSLFQFGYSDSLSNIDGVGTLALINCTFQNFFYDFNSFIGLTNGHGKISISETTFDKFSNCGSIIRDTAEYPTNLNYINLGMQTSTTTTYRDSMFTSNLYQNKYFIKPSAACKSDSCASINIESSTFQNFNYLKTGGLTYHKVSSNSNMKYQGLILNLNNFYGTVAFYNNQISSLKFAYNNCEEVYNSATSLDTANIWGTPTILQAKTLIYINVKSSAVEIYGNTFSKCNSLLGLIYLQRSSDYFTPILIHGNIFTLNSAIMGSNLIKLYLYTKNSFKDLFSNEDMICAGVQISNNNFTQNIGCFNTIGAIQCI